MAVKLALSDRKTRNALGLKSKSSTGTATTFLRLAVRLLSVRARHSRSKPVLLLGDPDGDGEWIPSADEDVIHDSWEDVEELSPETDEALEALLARLQKGRVEELEGGVNAVRLLSGSRRASWDDVFRLLCRISMNAMTLAPEAQVRRALTSSKSRWKDFGIGLYPSGAMLNHSCFPSCLWFVRSGTLIVETLRVVRRGEELTIAYLPVSGTVTQRRRRLLHAFGFHCVCSHCEAESNLQKKVQRRPASSEGSCRTPSKRSRAQRERPPPRMEHGRPWIERAPSQVPLSPRRSLKRPASSRGLAERPQKR